MNHNEPLECTLITKEDLPNMLKFVISTISQESFIRELGLHKDRAFILAYSQALCTRAYQDNLCFGIYDKKTGSLMGAHICMDLSKGPVVMQDVCTTETRKLFERLDLEMMKRCRSIVNPENGKYAYINITCIGSAYMKNNVFKNSIFDLSRKFLAAGYKHMIADLSNQYLVYSLSRINGVEIKEVVPIKGLLSHEQHSLRDSEKCLTLISVDITAARDHMAIMFKSVPHINKAKL